MRNIKLTGLLLLLTAGVSLAQKPLFCFGKGGLCCSPHGKKDKGNGNGFRPTRRSDLESQWEGADMHRHPIGVIRSAEKYSNFLPHIEWKHMEAGGNSGTFVWSSAEPGKNRLPDGVEVQMLELDWVNQNVKDGVVPPIAYVHGELFGVGGVETVPDNPRGNRSKSVENRCKGKGEWNTYDVVCVDGTIKLSVNGKFVNGISKSSQKEGYICLESEGAEIRFRNIRIARLP